MSQKALRSPQYINVTAAASTLSTELKILIDGTLRYTINKNTTAGSNVIFEWAELARDYFNLSFSGPYTIPELTVRLQIRGFAGANGTGNPTEVISDTTLKAVNGWGTFMEGSNPSIPFAPRTSPAWLVCSQNSAGQSQIFVPIGQAGKAQYMQDESQANVISNQDYSTTDIEIGGEGEITEVLKINRIDCTKYGTGTQFTFQNKFGMYQDIWFFLKQVKKLNRTSETFQRNIVNPAATTSSNNFYNVNEPAKKSFNTEGHQSNTFSSGYYPEEANCMFEQLILSTHVYMHRPKGSTFEIVPVMVKSSDLVYKTSLNDKLIEYTIEFEDAFDYINNIR